MKKIALVLIFILISVFALSGCGDSDAPNTTVTPSTSTSPSASTEVNVPKGEIVGKRAREYILYVPQSYNGEKMPLLIMLHGGGQTAYIFSDETGMNVRAEENGFMVLYVSQDHLANSNLYFNWFNESSQKRDDGDCKAIMSCFDEVAKTYNIGDVYCAGFSAGACQTVNMAVCYPDLIKGVAIDAGVTYAAASSASNALNAMASGIPSGTLLKNNELAVERIKPYASGEIKTLVFHGDIDAWVDIENGRQLVKQFKYINDYLDDGEINSSVVELGEAEIKTVKEREVTITEYVNADGTSVVKSFFTKSYDHNWSGDSCGGGIDNKTVNYNEEIVNFFGLNKII